MVTLQLKRILSQRTVTKVLKALEALPSDLVIKYQGSISRVQKQDDDDRELGMNVL